MLLENTEWYVSYYDENNHYHSTNFFQNKEDAINNKMLFEENGMQDVRIIEFRY